MAERAGEDALVAVYEDVASGRDLGPALRERAGFGPAGLTRRWRAVLDDLAGGGPA